MKNTFALGGAISCWLLGLIVLIIFREMVAGFIITALGSLCWSLIGIEKDD